MGHSYRQNLCFSCTHSLVTWNSWYAESMVKYDDGIFSKVRQLCQPQAVAQHSSVELKCTGCVFTSLDHKLGKVCVVNLPLACSNGFDSVCVWLDVPQTVTCWIVVSSILHEIFQKEIFLFFYFMMLLENAPLKVLVYFTGLPAYSVYLEFILYQCSACYLVSTL